MRRSRERDLHVFFFSFFYLGFGAFERHCVRRGDGARGIPHFFLLLFFFFFYLFFFFPSQMEMPIRGRSAFLSFSSPLRSGGRKERPRDPPPPPLPQKNRAATGRLLDEINGREWRGGSGLWLKGLFLGAFGTD